MDQLYCPKCGNPNESSYSFCIKCGTPLPSTEGVCPVQSQSDCTASTLEPSVAAQTPPPTQPVHYYQLQQSVNPDELIVGIPAREYAAFIGKNADYYLPEFKKMAQTGSKAGWSWPAFLLPDFWALVRRMPKIFFVFLLIQTLLSLPTLISSIFGLTELFQNIPLLVNIDPEALANSSAVLATFSTFSTLSLLSSIAIRVVMGILGNYFYFEYCTRKIIEIRSYGLSMEGYYQTLQAKGSTKVANPFIYFGVTFLLSFVLSIVFSIILISSIPFEALAGLETELSAINPFFLLP